MFQWNMNFRVPEPKNLTINEWTWWMYQNWIEQHLQPNTLANIENFDYNDTWSLMSRKAIINWLWVYSSDDNSNYPIIAFWQLWAWAKIMVKWANFYYVENFWLWTKLNWRTLPSSISSTSVDNNTDFDLLNLNTFSDTNIISSTITEYNERYVKTWTTLTKDNHIWQYIKIWNEIKYITSNTTDTIFIQWKFDEVYTTSTSFVIRSTVPALVLKHPSISSAEVIYWFSTPFNFKQLPYWIRKWEIHKNRLFFWKTSYDSTRDRLYFTELWILDWSWKNNYIEVDWEIKQIKSFWDRLVIYTNKDIIYLHWDNEDNFTLEYLQTSKVLEKINSVATWNNIQFFYWKDWIEILDAIDNKNSANTFWISEKIKDFIKENSSTTWHTFSWIVYDNKYFLCLWRKILVYDIDKSQKFQNHIYTIYDFWDYFNNPISQYSEYKITAIKIISWQLVFAINWWSASLGSAYYRPNPSIQSTQPLIIESNKINLWDEFRKKIFRRIKLSLWQRNPSPQNPATYTIKVYIKFDNWNYNLIKTTTNLQEQIFFTWQMKQFQYKLEITSTASSIYTPLEILQMDIQYELLTKY